MVRVSEELSQVDQKAAYGATRGPAVARLAVKVAVEIGQHVVTQTDAFAPRETVGVEAAVEWDAWYDPARWHLVGLVKRDLNAHVESNSFVVA